MSSYLLPSDQEEVDGRQVYAEFLAEAHQQVPDGHAGPQRDRATRAVRQANVALPQGGAAPPTLRSTGGVALEEEEEADRKGRGEEIGSRDKSLTGFAFKSEEEGKD